MSSERILRYLPEVLKSHGAGPTMQLLLRALGAEFSGIDDDLRSILRSHWVMRAESIEDLGAIADLVGIRRREGESVRQLRTRLLETIAAYREGVGTVDVVRRIAATTLGIPLSDEIELIENPRQRVTTPWVRVTARSQWTVAFQGLGPGEVTIAPYPVVEVRGVGNRTVNPVIRNDVTGTRAAYYGLVGDKQVLSFYPSGATMLDGRDVSSYGGYEKKRGLPLGTSTWQYEARGSAFAPPDRPSSRFDQAVFDSGLPVEWTSEEPAEGNEVASVRLRWEERRPATFFVRIPWNLVETPAGVDIDPRYLVVTEVNRVKAAGVRAFVDYTIGSDRPLFAEHHRTRSGLAFALGASHIERQRVSATLHATTVARMQEEMQTMRDRLLFRGAFDVTRLNTSIFK